MPKRARKTEPAVRATISQFLDAVLSKKGATLIRSKEHVVFLNDDEMDRLAGEWLAFRGETVVGLDPNMVVTLNNLSSDPATRT